MKNHLITKAFALVFLQNFVFFCLQTIQTPLPAFLAAYGASKTYLGLFMNLNAVCLVAAVILLGVRLEKIPRKRIILVGYVLCLAAFPAMIFAGQNLWILLALKALTTVAYAGAVTVFAVEALEVIPPQFRVGGVAIFGLSGHLATPLASFLGEVLSARFGAPGIFLGAAVLALGGIILAQIHRFHTSGPHGELAHPVKFLTGRDLRGPVVCAFVFGGAYAVYASFLSNLTMERLGHVMVTPFFAALSVTTIVVRVFFSGVIDRWPRGILLTSAFVAIGVSFGLAAGLSQAWVLLPMGILYGWGHSLLFPVLTATFVNAGPEAEKFARGNAFSVVNTLGNVVLALALGGMGDGLGTGWIFAAMGAAALSVVPLALRSRSR